MNYETIEIIYKYSEHLPAIVLESEKEILYKQIFDGVYLEDNLVPSEYQKVRYKGYGYFRAFIVYRYDELSEMYEIRIDDIEEIKAIYR